MADKEELYRNFASAISETTGGNMTPEMVKEYVERDLSDVQDAWGSMASPERKVLETEYKATGNRDESISKALSGWDEQFNMPRKVAKIQTNRDIYNELKSVYDESGGDWDMVYKVAKYNQVPKELMNEFVKDGQWTDYEMGSESGAGYGAVARGATSNLYGGLANVLTGGKYANVDVVPRGMEFDDQANTLWRAGVRQANAYGRSMSETNPGMELTGQLIGSLAPLGAATKATKGIKVASDATRAGRIANTFGKGLATGALFSVPEALSQESVGDALSKTLTNSLIFGGGDVALSGLGAGLGAFGRGVSKISKPVSEPQEGLIKAFQKIKPVSEMSEAELKQGMKNGWISPEGEFNIVEYLSKEHGASGTEIMDSLAELAKTNRELYNKIKGELKNFHYSDAIKKASKDAMIPKAPLSRFNRILEQIPARLDKFADDVIGYKSFSGRAVNTMEEFNNDIKYALRSFKPNQTEQKAINKYLKDVESANMKQHLVNELPTELKAVDKSKTLPGELLKNLSIVGLGPLIKSPIRVMQDRIQRNYIRQLISGEERRPTIIKRLLEKTGRAGKVLGPAAENLQPYVNVTGTKLIEED